MVQIWVKYLPPVKVLLPHWLMMKYECNFLSTQQCGFLFLMQADFSGSSVDKIVTPRNMGKCKILKWNMISKLITYFCLLVSDVCNILSSLGCINVSMRSIIREKRGWHVVSSTLRNDKRMSEVSFTVR